MSVEIGGGKNHNSPAHNRFGFRFFSVKSVEFPGISRIISVRQSQFVESIICTTTFVDQNSFFENLRNSSGGSCGAAGPPQIISSQTARGRPLASTMTDMDPFERSMSEGSPLMRSPRRESQPKNDPPGVPSPNHHSPDGDPTPTTAQEFHDDKIVGANLVLVELPHERCSMTFGTKADPMTYLHVDIFEVVKFSDGGQCSRLRRSEDGGPHASCSPSAGAPSGGESKKNAISQSKNRSCWGIEKVILANANTNGIPILDKGYEYCRCDFCRENARVSLETKMDRNRAFFRERSFLKQDVLLDGREKDQRLIDTLALEASPTMLARARAGAKEGSFGGAHTSRAGFFPRSGVADEVDVQHDLGTPSSCDIVISSDTVGRKNRVSKNLRKPLSDINRAKSAPKDHKDSEPLVQSAGPPSEQGRQNSGVSSPLSMFGSIRKKMFGSLTTSGDEPAPPPGKLLKLKVRS